jgi:hypothetical protein
MKAGAATAPPHSAAGSKPRKTPAVGVAPASATPAATASFAAGTPLPRLVQRVEALFFALEEEAQALQLSAEQLTWPGDSRSQESVVVSTRLVEAITSSELGVSSLPAWQLIRQQAPAMADLQAQPGTAARSETEGETADASESIGSEDSEAEDDDYEEGNGSQQDQEESDGAQHEEPSEEREVASKLKKSRIGPAAVPAAHSQPPVVPEQDDTAVRRPSSLLSSRLFSPFRAAAMRASETPSAAPPSSVPSTATAAADTARVLAPRKLPRTQPPVHMGDG